MPSSFSVWSDHKCSLLLFFAFFASFAVKSFWCCRLSVLAGLTRTSQFFAAQLLTQEWSQPVDAEHRLFGAASDIKDSDGHVLVTAYAVLRPDGQWSLLLINKDYDNPHPVRIAFRDRDTNTDTSFSGPVTMITFGKAQYQWHPGRKEGYADPDGPAATSTVTGDPHAQYTLPPASMTVVRGKVR